VGYISEQSQNVEWTIKLSVAFVVVPPLGNILCRRGSAMRIKQDYASVKSVTNSVF
jgi:hypothetical protein